MRKRLCPTDSDRDPFRQGTAEGSAYLGDSAGVRPASTLPSLHSSGDDPERSRANSCIFSKWACPRELIEPILYNVMITIKAIVILHCLSSSSRNRPNWTIYLKGAAFGVFETFKLKVDNFTASEILNQNSFRKGKLFSFLKNRFKSAIQNFNLIKLAGTLHLVSKLRLSKRSKLEILILKLQTFESFLGSSKIWNPN